mmetsp:Transcript_65548/g.189018  ORF Transcript_65548/g.189018 Transcript_65548/m.189018 type:complete len:293 (+) Transcript_65548:38-916(+)
MRCMVLKYRRLFFATWSRDLKRNTQRSRTRLSSNATSAVPARKAARRARPSDSSHRSQMRHTADCDLGKSSLQKSCNKRADGPQPAIEAPPSRTSRHSRASANGGGWKSPTACAAPAASASSEHSSKDKDDHKGAKSQISAGLSLFNCLSKDVSHLKPGVGCDVNVSVLAAGGGAKSIPKASSFETGRPKWHETTERRIGSVGSEGSQASAVAFASTTPPSVRDNRNQFGSYHRCARSMAAPIDAPSNSCKAKSANTSAPPERRAQARATGPKVRNARMRPRKWVRFGWNSG